MKSANKYWLIGIIVSIAAFSFFGIITAMIKNAFFIRMTPVNFWDWVILAITSVLIGVYVGLYYYKKKQQSTKAVCAATSGGILGFLTFGCAICNKILIAILGFVGVTTYFMPIQPYFGLVSVGLLGYGIYDMRKK